jgi:large subunit ribosomal protein MRP49
MIVNRKAEKTGPATMTLYFRDKDANSTIDLRNKQLASSTTGHSLAPEPTDGERAVKIDMRMMHSSAILKELLNKTGAVPVVPTPQDEADVREMDELKERGEVDRAMVKKVLEAERRERAHLKAISANN